MVECSGIQNDVLDKNWPKESLIHYININRYFFKSIITDRERHYKSYKG